MRHLVYLLVLLPLVNVVPLWATEIELDAVEQQAMADTFQYALENNPTRQSSDWVNPDTQRSGNVVPVRTFNSSQGQPCREFITSIIIADKEEQGYGTACRQPDGSWKIINDEQQSVPATPPQVTRKEYLPPASYYAYPSGFYGPYRIYLSFGTVYRGGHVHYGSYYLKARDFRYRYPLRVHSKHYYGPRLYKRHRIYEELEYRDWERRGRIDKREKKEWKRWEKEMKKERYKRRHDRYKDDYDDGHKRRHGKRHDD